MTGLLRLVRGDLATHYEDLLRQLRKDVLQVWAFGLLTLLLLIPPMGVSTRRRILWLLVDIAFGGQVIKRKNIMVQSVL